MTDRHLQPPDEPRLECAHDIPEDEWPVCPDHGRFAPEDLTVRTLQRAWDEGLEATAKCPTCGKTPEEVETDG